MDKFSYFIFHVYYVIEETMEKNNSTSTFLFLIDSFLYTQVRD